MLQSYSSDLAFNLYLVCFYIMKLKFSMNIGLTTYPLSSCSIRWRPVQGVPRLFYTEPLVKADMGGLERTLLCQGPVELTRGTKTNRRHLSLFDDVLVVSSNL